MYIHHINISAPSDKLKQTRDFYCSVFNLTDGYRPTFNSNSKGYWLYANDIPLIHLTESDKHYQNNKQGYFDHIAFQTTGLFNMVRNLKSMGVLYEVDYLPEINMTQLFFKDLLGIGVEVNFVDEKL
jgi:4-hydroxyphenylpyruvate dioxygenase-like putative hemolysin